MGLQLNQNERWYEALTALWSVRLRGEGGAGPHRPPAADVSFAADVMRLAPGARVFDLACGWGRTTLELARRGFAVTGFDLSAALLPIAREQAGAAGLDIAFHRGTVRCLPDLGRFDAVTAFYDDSVLSFAEEADNLRALRGVARSLRSGGGFLFGTTDCALIIEPYQRQERWQDGVRIVEQITFDAVARTGTSKREHHYPDGRTQRYRRTRRHYSLDEASALLAGAGLTVREMWCAYDRALPYGSRPEGMVVFATRDA
jgi:cyclopropane fatty-acyl-phospholipid synthase-like methyltransferase